MALSTSVMEWVPLYLGTVCCNGCLTWPLGQLHDVHCLPFSSHFMKLAQWNIWLSPMPCSGCQDSFCLFSCGQSQWDIVIWETAKPVHSDRKVSCQSKLSSHAFRLQSAELYNKIKRKRKITGVSWYEIVIVQINKAGHPIQSVYKRVWPFFLLLLLSRVESEAKTNNNNNKREANSQSLGPDCLE